MNTLIATLYKDERLNALTVGILLLALAVIMEVFSLTSLNDKASKGYLVNKLESERQDLVRDGEITDMLNLRARSLESIKTSDTVTRMLKPSRENIVYVTPVTVVAQR